MFGSVLWSKSTGCSPELYAQMVPPVGLEPTLEGFYLLPVLLITPTEIGLEVTFEIPSVTGSAVASTVT
jgi:hypothetical protein